MKAKGAALAGSVVSGVLASACCLGPVVFALLGISGAAFARRFEPFRPYLLLVTYVLLAGAFYLTYRPTRNRCGAGETCEMPRASHAGRILLWLPVAVVVLTTTFPWYAVYLF